MGSVVQSDDNTSSPSFDTAVDVSLTAVDLDHTFNTHTNKVPGAGTAFPRTHLTSFLSDPTTLQLRNGYSGRTKTATYYVGDTSTWAATVSVSNGSLMSPEIDFDDGNTGPLSSLWGEVQFDTDETNGDIKLQIYYSATTLCDTIIPDIDLTGNSIGFDTIVDISGLDTSTYNKICLRADFIDIGATPDLLDWTVTWGGNQKISFTLSDTTIGYDLLSESVVRYATGDETGSNFSVAAHSVEGSSNASNGYVIELSGSELTCQNCDNAHSIRSIGGVATASALGTEQFGIRASSLGTGVVSSPYNNVNHAYDFANFPDETLTGIGDDTITTYDIEYLGNISPLTSAGEYTATLTYTIHGIF
jgi:hypothetical protein